MLSMFGRKKSKDERKKKHKPSMSAADLSKLDEVAARRGMPGIFSKNKVGKKDKDDHDGSKHESSSSVLQKATKYGSVVRRMSSASESPDTHHKSPVATPLNMRPQSMQINSSTTSLQAPARNSYYESSTYDIPKAPARKSKPKYVHEYSVPRLTKEVATKKTSSGKLETNGSRTDLTRLVTLKKRETGDFGLSLRKSAVVEYGDGQAITKTVFFAEPGAVMLMESEYDGNNPAMLHVGDRLAEIDGVNVESALREEVVSRIKSAGSTVRLLVRSTTDDSLVRSSSKARIDSPSSHRQVETSPSPSQVTTSMEEEKFENHPVKFEVPSGVEWVKKELVWLKQPDGIVRANIVVPDQITGDGLLPSLPSGMCRVQLCQNDELYMAADDDVEQANAIEFDKANDLAILRYLNESSFLHTLAHKYGQNLHYTYIGPHLLSITSHQQEEEGRANFTEQKRQYYKKSRYGEGDAHIYATAQHAHKQMMRDYIDQSILNIGCDGKNSDIFHLLQFYVAAYSSNPKVLNEDKVGAVKCVLKSLTWAKTASSPSCNRCLMTHQLVFTKHGNLKSWSPQTLLMDHMRIVQRNEDESNFDVFYQIYFGADGQLRKELLLGDWESRSNPILFGGKFEPTPQFISKSKEHFINLMESLQTLGFTSEQQKAVFYVIAVCIHLGMAGCRQVNENKVQFECADHAQKAASLLGTSTDKLCALVFQTGTSGSGTLRNVRRQSSGKSSFKQNEDTSGMAQLNSFICNLYKETLQAVISFISRSLNFKDVMGKCCIYLLDSPGYLSNCKGSAGISDLSFNYIQDRLNALFYQRAVTASKDRYMQEGIQVDVHISDNEDSLSSGADVIDKPIVQLRGKPSKGLFRLIEEEIGGRTSAEELIERIHINSSQNKNEAVIVQRSREKKRFVFRHHSATYPVEYDVTDWLDVNLLSHDHPDVADTLKNSKKCSISELFGGKLANHQATGNKSAASHLLNESGGNSTLRRVSSFKKTFSSVTNQSYCGYVKIQVDNMIDRLARTRLHFILSLTVSASTSDDVVGVKSFNPSFVRQQLQGFRVLDITRIHKQGFPENMVMTEFRHRFAVLCDINLPDNDHKSLGDYSDEQKFAQNILTTIDMDASQYRVGISEIFFRAGALNHLYDLRDEKITARILRFQSHCRGYLARKRLKKRKVQDVAVRILQRNIQLFMNVRQWPWWKLVTKIIPLIEVNRAEDELKEKQAELELMKEKFDRVSKEKEDALHTNEQVEQKVEEIMQMLEDERATATSALQLLDDETKEKKKYEKENEELHERVAELEMKVKTLETEAANVKRKSDIDIIIDRKLSTSSDEEDGTGIDYKSKYERTIREHNFKMKEKMRENEDIMEELRENKKALERKMIQMKEEIDEHVRVENQHKKKAHKLQSEHGDAKIHVEELSSKNHDLEKKQRKIDAELNSLHKEISELKSSRDRFQREKDRFAFDNNSVTKELEEKNEELELAMNKVKFLEQELDETQLRDTDDKQMVNKLKKKVRDLEAKVTDQEEELDEQAGTIQTLEQAKERLEMSSDQLRSQHQREISNKDEEYEEFRISYQKKLKVLEEQLQEADDERGTHVKQRRQLEQQIFELKENGSGGNGAEYEKQLRSGLKRYKSLYADSQTMVDHLKTNAVNKQQMRQLKTKLEESEYSCAAAVKSRKAIELELEDLQTQLEDISRSKQESESRAKSLQHRVHSLQSQIEEDTEDTGETMTKYKNLIIQQEQDHRQLVELQNTVDELKLEGSSLEEKVADLQSQLDHIEETSFDRANYNRLESKAKDLEMKLDYQKTSCKRLEIQLARAKENNDRVMSERDAQAAIAQRERDAVKRVNKQMRETKEEQAELVKKEQDSNMKKDELQLEFDEQANQIESLQADLSLALRRVQHLQDALKEVEDSDYEYDSSDDDGSSMTSSISSDIDDDEYLGRRSRIGSTRSRYSTRPRVASSSSYSSNLAADDGDRNRHTLEDATR